MSALELIQQEREKQIRKGFNADHDDQHEQGELHMAAASIIQDALVHAKINSSDTPKWIHKLSVRTFNKHFTNHKCNLVVAAALLIAEIERLERLEGNTKPNPPAIPPEANVFNLNRSYAVWVVAETLEQALQHYGELMRGCGLEFIELIEHPHRVEPKVLDTLIYNDDDGTKRSFREQITREFADGKKMPFLLAAVDF